MIIYIIPFFHRTFLSFYLICVDNVPWEQGKVLLNCFFRRENRERVNHPAFRFHLGGEKRCLNDTLDLEKLILREAPVSLPIPPVPCSMPSSRQHPFLTQVLRDPHRLPSSVYLSRRGPEHSHLCDLAMLFYFPTFQPNKSTCSPQPSAPSTPFSFHKVHHICSNLFHLSSYLDENSRTAGTVTIVSPGPNRLNWHTVGASEVHTHLHAFAHAAPSASNACTPISAC